jgi:trans-aconitate 2-methyltransferase
MIDKANKNYPNGKWVLSDARDLDLAGKYDIVFSNAVLQWIPEHEKLIPKLISLVSHGGVLAFQVPQNQHSKIHLSLYGTASESKFKDYTEQAKTILNYKTGTYYYNLLNAQVKDLNIWETTYYHILDNHDELINWYKSTGMRPFLNRLSEDLKNEFINSVKLKCISAYPVQNDGKVIFPFNRLFVIAYVK